ncbi:MAG: hypothetical protein ACI3X1_06780 [Eubacteriales bacterium]
MDKNKEDKWVSSSQYNMIGQKVVTDDGTPYFSYKMGTQHPDSAEFTWNREDNPKINYVSPVGASRYFVVRMRVRTAGTGVYLYLSTVGEPMGGYATIPVSSAGAGEWATYVIDLEAAIGSTYYAKNDDGVYDIDTFHFTIYNASIKDTIDIQYFAFVETDNLADLKTIIDEPEYRFVSTKNGGNAVYDTATGTKKN